MSFSKHPFWHLNRGNPRARRHSVFGKGGVVVLRTLLIACLTVLAAFFALAKDKSKITIPADVLNARTVLVVIKPNAGEPITDPTANQRAQEDVEKALMKWRRFDLAMEPNTADLIIAIRKGSGKLVTPTMTGGPIDQRPVILEPHDGGIRIGGQRGTPPSVTQDAGASQTSQDSTPRTQTEVGPSVDTFEVYRGQIANPLDAPPVWRYMRKDALRAPAVPAVDEFRKVIEEAAKAQDPKKQP